METGVPPRRSGARDGRPNASRTRVPRFRISPLLRLFLAAAIFTCLLAVGNAAAGVKETAFKFSHAPKRLVYFKDSEVTSLGVIMNCC